MSTRLADLCGFGTSSGRDPRRAAWRVFLLAAGSWSGLGRPAAQQRPEGQGGKEVTRGTYAPWPGCRRASIINTS